MNTIHYAMTSLVLVLVSATLAVAQPSGVPIKARGAFGEGFWEASKRQEHARDHSQILYNYTQPQQSQQQPQPIAASKVQEHSTAIRQNVEAAQAALVAPRKAYVDNKEVQAALAKIEALHVKVCGHCDVLDAQVKSATTDTVVIHDCCVDAYKDLDEANEELTKLLKSLKITNPAPPKRLPNSTTAK
jgi:hypothetical protein